LSRGYGRKTKGFLFADVHSSSKDVGDEPLLIHKKYPDTPVAVCKNRLRGLDRLMEEYPQTDVVLLDDAYQYMPLKQGLSILLTDYYNSYMSDHTVPVGRLREGRSAAKDADIIIVTKSPKVVPTIEEKLILEKISPRDHQEIYFSYIEFEKLIPLTQKAEQLPIGDVRSAVALCGIANPYPFLEYINQHYSEVQKLVYPDHYRFTSRDIQKMKAYVGRALTKKCAVITTEKDAMRLIESEFKEDIETVPIFYLPIEVKFHPKYQEKFDRQIQNYVDKNKTDR
jgi:tetraacyldisaccharide 4'-kinase